MTPLCRHFILLLLLAMPFALFAQDKDSPRWALAVHGGAGSSWKRLDEKEKEEVLKALRAAVEAGKQMLSDGQSSVDVVENVVRQLEDHPLFNAGRGAVFNSAGGHELDASIMDGRDKSCGGVAAVRTVKNPVSLARLVMTKTRHVLLIGDGAEEFAEQMKVERVEPSYFDTEQAYENWQRAMKKEKDKQQSAGEKHGTVGCVALDLHGNLAAATSTGGITNKRFGRVGDSPIVGAGTYADNETCAVSGTGVGEEYIRNALAYDISALMKYKGWSAKQAAQEWIHKRLKAGVGGVIVVDREGAIVMEFNTEAMARGAADSTGRFEVKLE